MGDFMAFAADSALAPSIVNSSVERTREYLTANEVEKLMVMARKSSRYGHRDATMILIVYRHGLRASEIGDLQWHQVELNAGRLHVRRSKRGTPSVHPIQGDEQRALRRLQREQAPSPYVFTSERGGPIAPKSFHTLMVRLGKRADIPFPIAHASARVRLRPGERGARYAGDPSLDGAQEYPAYRALHGVGAGSVQELLAGLALRSTRPVADTLWFP
jgi:integrase